MVGKCAHADAVHDVTPSARGCEECLKTGDWWGRSRSGCEP